MTEPIYTFVKGQGWVPKLPSSRETRHLGQMRSRDICPRCGDNWGNHSDWACPDGKGWWPHEWDGGDERCPNCTRKYDLHDGWKCHSLGRFGNGVWPEWARDQ